MITKIIVFAVLSILIFLKFRKELSSYRRHGPYMFGAFQTLLLLFVINAGSMFEDPFAVRQIFSWALMIVSAATALSGFHSLKRHGRAVQDWENTTRLVREGVFKYIRHPLYASLMLLAVGVLLKNLSVGAALACIITLCFLVFASRAEENENREKFGEEYECYALSTKRYVPFIV
jgi:protein-S-isoprenylcysteine O-methyltransferase Ste14